jgi:hypothetical protein
MTLKTFLYPTLGSNKAKNLSDVANLVSELNAVLEKYVKQEGIPEHQMIKLPGLNEASESVKAYKKELAGSKNELAVRGGINGSGHLAVTISGIVPRKGKPVPIDDEIIVRKDFATVIEEMKNEAHAVVNLQKGNDIIDRASTKQGGKFGTPVQEPDDADFGDIKTGFVVLAAHGGRAEVNGTIIGTSLGKRSAADIVKLLTEGDKKKRLHPDFSGTVWLSGCFTAAGGIAPPGHKFDHESFARSVWELLKAKGYKKATVKGQPGTARTDAQGDKSSVTPTGQKDYDKLKKELADLNQELKTVAAELQKIKDKHDSDEEMRADPGFRKQFILLNELKKIATRIEAEKESHVIEKLVATYGATAR